MSKKGRSEDLKLLQAIDELLTCELNHLLPLSVEDPKILKMNGYDPLTIYTDYVENLRALINAYLNYRLKGAEELLDHDNCFDYDLIVQRCWGES